MAGISNIVDAMLVFACGLMLSLVINWNVDLVSDRNLVEMEQGKDVSEVKEVRESLVEDFDDAGNYKKMGIVYKDSATGKLFMLTDE